MIAPKDALSQVQTTSATRRVPVAPSSGSSESRLNAPLANFDDGFSSDQGAFLSGAETEREVTPNTDRDESPDRTPVREFPSEAVRGAATLESPVSVAEIEDNGDIVKTAKITISPPKEPAADEARASLLLNQHDSLEMDVDEASSSASPPLPQNVPMPHQASPTSHVDFSSGSNSPNLINQQLRQQYEIQAVSRPRPTTPVSACAIESFVAVNPRRTSDAEKLKISLPGSSFVAAPAATVPEVQPEEAKPTGSHKLHRRRSSMSWTEFQENMAASSYSASGTASGRASGRTTPLSSSVGDDDNDLFEQNPVYQDRVPPSPVVHRRASREWVDFEEFGTLDPSANGGAQRPPLSELVTEIQQTVDAWQKTDYSGGPLQKEFSNGLIADKQIIRGEEEQYPPPPFDAGVGLYEEPSWQQQSNDQQFYGQQPNYNQQPYQQQSSYQQPYQQQPTYDQQYYNEETGVYSPADTQQYQEPPQEPYYDYSAYGAGTIGHQNYYSNNTSAYDLDETYPPPPPPAPAPTSSSYKDDWSSQIPGNASLNTMNAYDKSTPATSMQFAPANDDWDSNPYAQLQLSYQQQQPPPEPEPIEKSPQNLVDQKSSTSAPSRAAPAPPPQPAATGRAEKESKTAASEEWLAFERMTQKMNLVVKQTQEKLQEIQKETVAKILPSTPYEIATGQVAQSPQQQPPPPPPPEKTTPTPVDLLSSDFEPVAPAAPTSFEQAATPRSSSSASDGKEWKPIHEVLNEEIKKQKELQKPKRPPPPKSAPQRPPRPGATATAVLPSWDDAAPKPAPAAMPSWDDDETAQWNAAKIDTFPSAVDPAVPEAPRAAATMPSTLSNTSAIDSSRTQEKPPEVSRSSDAFLSTKTVPISFDSTELVREQRSSFPETLEPVAMAGSIPFTKSDIANQNHLQRKNEPADDALFDTSKYANLISGEHRADRIPADDFDVFLKSENAASTPSPVVPPPPPIPPPRSPGPERKFVIEKAAAPAPARAKATTTPGAGSNANWADFEGSDVGAVGAGGLPPSESDFYLKMTGVKRANAETDPFAPQTAPAPADLLGSVDSMEESYDPFAVKSPEQIVAEAKAKAHAHVSAQEAVEDLDFFGASTTEKRKNEEEEKEGRSSPGFGFRDDFSPPANEVGGEDDEDGLPLYDEDDSKPLLEFPPKFTGDGWDMMLRFPVKKKMMAERCWKPIYVRLQGSNVELYYGKNDRLPFQTLPLLANYCLSDVTTQQYDVYGKIHTVKLQYVIYKEKVGLRPGQIPKLVEGHFTKLGLPLEHAAQTSVLLKFGSLHHDEMQTFVYAVEDVLFHIAAMRERPALYKQDEIQVHCYDEYASHVNKDGAVSDQRARVRLFCLAFVSGMPFTEIGLNDRRRQGKEIVRRKDIMPMYTERWIRFESLEFHSSVDKVNFDKEHVIRMQPLDACFFELLRFRVRPPKGKELPLHVRSIMKIAGSKIEIRIEAMVAVFKSRKARQVPCEDIQIRFPIPEAWIYLFREERHWGYGSVHAKVRRPGKVKNIKDKIMGIVQNADPSLIEVAIGDAKYEHVYRSLVWRIPRLPEKHHGAYKTHLLRCRFELSSFDLTPETFVPNCEVEYTMPMATVSHTVVRSVSIEQHEDPDKVEKWVRYLAKYQYTVEIDYVQTTDLDIEAIMDTTVLEPEKSLEKAPVKHQPSLDTTVAKDVHEGYRIDFSAAELGGGRYDKTEDGEGKRKSSSDSSDEDDARSFKPPLIQIDIKNYKY